MLGSFVFSVAQAKSASPENVVLLDGSEFKIDTHKWNYFFSKSTFGMPVYVIEHKDQNQISGFVLHEYQYLEPKNQNTKFICSGWELKGDHCEKTSTAANYKEKQIRAFSFPKGAKNGGTKNIVSYNTMILREPQSVGPVQSADVQKLIGNFVKEKSHK